MRASSRRDTGDRDPCDKYLKEEEEERDFAVKRRGELKNFQSRQGNGVFIGLMGEGIQRGVETRR